jgi:hypothetical protein
VIAEEPIEYFEGMPLGGDDREADLASVRALLALARERLAVEGAPIRLRDHDQHRPGSLPHDRGRIALLVRRRHLYSRLATA